MSQNSYYIDVIIPLNLWNSFTYEVTKDEFDFLQKGMRVAVNFGKQKLQTAIVYKKHHQKPLHYEIKKILYIVDNQPIITEKQWQLFHFISDYYLTPLGLVIKAALPGSFMLESETYIVLNKNIQPKNLQLNDDEYLIIEALLQQKTINVKTFHSLFKKKNIFKIIDRLLNLEVVHSLHEVKEKYHPKKETYLQLSPQWQGKKMAVLFELLSKRAEKQREVLLRFFSLQRQGRPVLKKQLKEQSGVSASVIKTLIDKGIFYETQTTVDRINFEQASEQAKSLSPEQDKVLVDIKSKFKDEKPILLHGITSSGKTELYIHLIKEAITQGKQVLYLVPEIALTTQLVQRLIKVFGNEISVYHSKYSQQERHEVWMKVLQYKPSAQIILAARSGIFLPFDNLGLIIVDEEHDASYKQVSPSPRYQARDMAVLLHKIHACPVLLGSATPSVETFYNTKRQRYLLTELKKRFRNIQLQEIEIVDLKRAKKQNKIKNNFSEVVLTEIHKTLQQKKQVMVFQNRRGFAPLGQCEDCGHVMECPHCDVTLTLHKHQQKLKCHYCGYQLPKPLLCPVCGNPSINYKGLGTEQIQNDLQQLFPNAVVDRLDSDTTRGKKSFSKILSAFQNLETDILVGTQMLVKGLDFEQVGLVVVVNADQLLFYPDFRADERAFQMLMQVSGRAGRKKERGKVLIQTYNSQYPILQLLLTADYHKMYETQIKQRRELFYPPFSKMIIFKIKDKNLQKTIDASEWLFTSFKNSFLKVLGPSDALIPRIKNKYIKEILIKLPADTNLVENKKKILKIMNTFHNIPYFQSIQVIIDVDPY